VIPWEGTVTGADAVPGADTVPGAAPVCLLVVADDLGYDPAIDDGLLEAHARGIVTAASAMVEGPFAPAALRRAPAGLAVGLHLVLAPGAPPAAARRAIARQLGRFEDLRGARPAHVDGHKHVHAEPAVLGALLEVAAELGLRVRALDPSMRDRIRRRGAPAADHFLGDAARRPFWTLRRLRGAVQALGPGTTELMCHPGRAPRHARTSFGVEREEELAALCDPGVREALRTLGIALVGRL
jgi:predicted glycoside hydrolase/deacetylase ChbG (UPF0249 family)